MRLLVVTVVCGSLFSPGLAQPKNRAPGQYLYVAASHVNKTQPDQLVVLQFNRSLPTYGQVVARVKLTTMGNELKLVTSDLNNTALAMGGFLSFVTGQMANQADTYIFNLANPASPTLRNATTIPTSGCPSIFVPLSDGSWVTTRMATKTGTAPGKLAIVDRQGRITEFGSGVDLNPHGLAVSTAQNMAITTDFIAPQSAIVALGARSTATLTVRNSIRIWRFGTRAIASTVRVADPRPGLLSVKFIPNDPLGRALMTGAYSGKIYLITPNATTFNATITTALDISNRLNSTTNATGPSYFDLVPKFKIGFVSLTFHNSILMFSYANPAALRVITVVPLGPSANPGYIEAFKKDDRLSVSTYFLGMRNRGDNPAQALLKRVPPEQPFGTILLGGTRTVRVFRFTNSTLLADALWKGTNILAGTGMSPHGLAYYPAN
jgi:hypothetical protein